MNRQQVIENQKKKLHEALHALKWAISNDDWSMMGAYDFKVAMEDLQHHHTNLWGIINDAIDHDAIIPEIKREIS